MLGIMSLTEAMEKASSLSLDLVEIASTSTPPVCKILDFSRYKYDAKKKKQDNKKKQKKSSMKEMKFSVNIAENDFMIKLNKIKGFLASKDKVKISVWFKGREIIYKDRGYDMCKKIIENLEEVGKVDAPPKLEGRQIIMILFPI